MGAPTYGTTNHVAFNGSPGNPTVWYDDGRNIAQVGVSAGGPSGEVDWAETAGSGAAYVLGFDGKARLVRGGRSGCAGPTPRRRWRPAPGSRRSRIPGFRLRRIDRSAAPRVGAETNELGVG